MDNLALKVVSLGLATVLWFVIAGEKTSEMGLAAHVELQNFPRDLEVTGEPVDAVEVRLRASPGLIQRIVPGDVSAQVDLAGMGEGEHIIHLTEKSLRMPFGVRVVKITPAILTVHLERTLQKVVPIHPRLIGRPAAGFEVGEVAADPSDVRIAGPKTRVLDVESAFTEPVSIEGAANTLADAVNMGLEDPTLRIQGSPRVRVSVRIQEVQETRTFDAVPVEPRGGAAGLRPDHVRVVLAGPGSLVRSTTLEEIRAHADVSQARAGQDVPVKVELAPGHAALTVRAVKPATVTVRPAKRAR